MVDKVEGLKEGDLVEVVLTPNAFKNKYDFVYPDEDVNEPGRKDVGYFAGLKDGSFYLCSQWNTVRNRGAQGIGEYHFSAVESYRKV